MQSSQNYSYIYIPPCIPRSYPSRSSQHTRLDSLCFRAASHWLYTLHMIMYIFHCCLLSSSHPLLPLLCPQVYSLHLPFHSFLANRHLFSRSHIYVLLYSICFSLWMSFLYLIMGSHLGMLSL